MKRQLISTTAAFAIASGFAAAAHAQPTAAPASETAAAAASDPGFALEEVVVTAQRRAENLQKAAVPVTAVSAEQIERAGVTDPNQLTRVAPALQVANVGGPINAYYLRGVGNFTTNSLSDPAIAVSIDGVYIARPSSVQGLFFDLQRVEVLKGPQGTLYGRNATGGAVNIISNKPEIGGSISGRASLEFSNFNGKKAEGAVNLPIGDNSALRIAGQVVSHDGYYTDDTGDQKQQSVRVQYANQINDDVKITAGFDYSHQGGTGAGATVHGLDRDERIGLLDPRAIAIYNSTFVFLAGNTLPALPSDLYTDNNFWGVYLQADVDTPIGTLTLLPAYRDTRLDFRTIAPSFPLTNRENGEQTSVEARIASHPGGSISYIAGVYYLNDRNHSNGSFDHQFFAAYTNFKPKTESLSGYGRLTWSVTDELRLSGGIRYTRDDKSADIDSVNALVLCPSGLVPPPATPRFCFGGPQLPPTVGVPAFLLGPTGAVIPAQPFGTTGNIVTATASSISPSETFSKVTYRAGVEYDVGENSMLYATYETGFKSGGFFSSIDDPTFRPETIDAITLGSKNRFFSNRLQLNLEAFRWTYKDQQVSHFRTNSAGGTEFVTENIGKTRLQGVELEMQAAVTADTILNGTVQYLDAHNIDFTYQNPATIGPPVTGCPISGPTNGRFTVDCGGRTPPMAPMWSVTAGIEQHFDLGGLGELVFNAQTRFQSKVWTGIELLSSQIQKSYTMTDIQLSYSPESDRFSIAAFVNNLEDNNVVGFSSPHPRAGSLIVENLRAPRTYGVRLDARF